MLSDRWCREADAEHNREQDARESREQVVFCSERDGGTCHHCRVHLATDVLTSGQDTDITTDIWTPGAFYWHLTMWHWQCQQCLTLQCPSDLSSDKNIPIKIFLKWLESILYPSVQNVDILNRHSPLLASAAQCWYEILNFLSLYTFSYCSKIYLLAEPGNFWSDEKSCFVAFYVAGWKKYCVYWMLKNNAIPKYLDYTISQSRG